jgi:hypothetical protein
MRLLTQRHRIVKELDCEESGLLFEWIGESEVGLNHVQGAPKERSA